MTMGNNIPILALLVSALAFGPAGSAFSADSTLQPMQLARLENGSQRGVAVKKASKRKK